jgi:acyl-CoA synthetase (AMP-forming)/AMP-acid ligase II
MTTLVEVLLGHASQRGDALAYTFLKDTGEEDSVTFAQLTQRALALSERLQEEIAPGERAVLFYQPGREFIEAIVACFMSGVVAVPVAPLRNAREYPRLANIVRDCDARLVLTNQLTRGLAAAALGVEPLPGSPGWICTDEVTSKGGLVELVAPSASERALRNLPKATELAFLQYTSGSTGDPKGVMVTHQNLMHNQEVIRTALGHDDRTVFAGWLPFYHDMGLIGNVFQPLFLGIRSVLFSPFTFLVAPGTWLRTISKYRATTSGGPSFAYELCVHRATEEDLEGLDLSSWTAAFNGAEPVKAHVIDAFARKFEPYGFKRSAFYPCYGLAEATLFVTGVSVPDDILALPVDTQALRENAVVEQPGSTSVLVSCGRANQGQRVAIVDPDTLQVLPEGRVGEIWIAGDSVTSGYWKKPDATLRTFGARTRGGEGPFLRTGDLGFSWRDELFISGRLKDLIIVRGRNYYPDDLESSVYMGRSMLRPGGAAAFVSNANSEERLVVVAEVQRTFLRVADARNIQQLTQKVRGQISDTFGLRLAELVLIRPGTLPKTSSGKLRRQRCRELYEGGELMRVEAVERDDARAITEGAE